MQSMVYHNDNDSFLTAVGQLARHLGRIWRQSLCMVITSVDFIKETQGGAVRDICPEASI